MDEEERNYCCLVILLARVGVDRLRHNFIRKWDEAGTFMPWNDRAQNGRDLLTKFKPLPYEKDKVKSGDTTSWDISLLANALRNTRPPLLTSESLVESLECLRETRNTVCHTPGGKITTADFKKLWNAVCNALGVFGATSDDFEKVKRDVMLPLNELTSLMKQCAKQDDEILRGLSTILTRLERLEHGLHKIKQAGQEEIIDESKEMVSNIDASSTCQVQLPTEGLKTLKQGQHKMKEGQEEINERQEKNKKGIKKIPKDGLDKVKQIFKKKGKKDRALPRSRPSNGSDQDFSMARVPLPTSRFSYDFTQDNAAREQVQKEDVDESGSSDVYDIDITGVVGALPRSRPSYDFTLDNEDVVEDIYDIDEGLSKLYLVSKKNTYSSGSDQDNAARELFQEEDDDERGSSDVYFPRSILTGVEEVQREEVEESGSSYVCIDGAAVDYLTALREVSVHQELQQHQQEQTLYLDEFGGSYDFSSAGLLLLVPPDAVNEKTNLTVKQLSKDTLPSPARELDGVVSSIIQFEPDNLVFEKPVVATILHYGPTRTAHYVNVAMAFKERTNTWERIQEIEEPSPSTNSTSSFVQVKLTKLTALTVVTRLITDTFVVPVSGCEVRSSVSQDVTLHFPAGGVDKSTKGSLRVLPMPDVMPMDIPNVQFSPIVVVDGFEQTDILKHVLLTLPNPTICPAGHERVVGQVRVLCHEGIEWKDITETVQYVEKTSTIELQVKHFSMLWVISKVGIGVVAFLPAVLCLYDRLKSGPKHVEYLACTFEERVLKILLVLTSDVRQLEAQKTKEEKYTVVARCTGRDDMYPNAKAYIKGQGGFICDEDKFLTLKEDTPCFEELNFRKKEVCDVGSEDKLTIAFYPTKDKKEKPIGELTVYESQLGLSSRTDHSERKIQDVSLMNLDREERDNFFQLTLLLFRDGNQKLREFFKSQWPVVYQNKTGIPPPSLWTDIPNDATEMNKIETKPMKFAFPDQTIQFISGDTNTWDFSLITTVLNNSTLKFVSPSTPESNAIKDLKEIRNKLIGHAPDAKLPTAVFNTEWPKACNALKTFGVTQVEIDQVKKDLKKPVDVLIPFLNESLKVEKEIVDSINKLEEKNEIRHEETLSAIQHASEDLKKDFKITIREEVGKLLKCAPISSEEQVQMEDVEESGSSYVCID